MPDVRNLGAASLDAPGAGITLEAREPSFDAPKAPITTLTPWCLDVLVWDARAMRQLQVLKSPTTRSPCLRRRVQAIQYNLPPSETPAQPQPNPPRYPSLRAQPSLHTMPCGHLPHSISNVFPANSGAAGCMHEAEPVSTSGVPTKWRRTSGSIVCILHELQYFAFIRRTPSACHSALAASRLESTRTARPAECLGRQ